MTQRSKCDEGGNMPLLKESTFQGLDTYKSNLRLQENSDLNTLMIQEIKDSANSQSLVTIKDFDSELTSKIQSHSE